MNTSRPLKEAVTFIALTLGASYLVFWGPLALFKIPTISFVSDEKGPGWSIALFILGGFVPSLAGLFLTWLWEGSAGLRQMGRRVIQFRIGWRWYLAAIGIIAAGTLAQVMLIRLMGHSIDASLFLAQLGSFLPLLILGPLSEELGWRGYAQDRLQTRFSPVSASFIVGAVWGLWHLPLFFLPGTSQHELAIPYIPFFCNILALSIVYGWLYNHTGGSIWTAIFVHWIYTYASQVVSSGIVQYPVYHWLQMITFSVIALLIMALWKPGTRTAQVSPQIQT